MKKAGFTVLETIVSLFIILIVFSCAAAGGKVEKSIYKDIESEGFIYEMHDFLTYAKLKSMQEGEIGKIVTIPANNKIYYYEYDDSRIMQTLNVPYGMKIIKGTTLIPISSEGRLNKAGTIEFQNYFNEFKRVKIRVGVDYINFED